ncbi:MAG: hypothetical protein WCD79_05405 [Chthoniobacteraceae bacterium]
MSRTFDEIIACLAALQARDFDSKTPGAKGGERLAELTRELRELPQPERAVPALFDVMERMPDSDLGTPGPLVHTLESMPGRYESELVESLRRRPVVLSIWMVNRILNAAVDMEQRQFYINLLGDAVAHPEASELVRDQALHFIQYQAKKSAAAY